MLFFLINLPGKIKFNDKSNTKLLFLIYLCVTITIYKITYHLLYFFFRFCKLRFPLIII